MRTDQVRREAKAGPLWDVWVRHGILTQDRGRGESPLRHFRRSDPREIRQKRLDALAAQIGSPRARRASGRRERRLREIRETL